MKSKYFSYLFFADLLLHLLSIAFQWNEIRTVSKILLVVILFAWFVSSSSKFSPLHFLIAAALIFSWLGDVFLLMELRSAVWFMAGLGSFLLAHIMYILFFLKVRKKQPVHLPWNIYLIAFITVYVASLFMLLYPHVGGLKIPVGAYAITIATMLATAIHAFNKSSKISAVYVIAGAILFVLSDSLLAVNKFYAAFTGGDVLIMLTYGLAQFVIIKGCLLYLAEENKS